jgi:hypothetical protein
MNWTRIECYMCVCRQVVRVNMHAYPMLMGVVMV